MKYRASLLTSLFMIVLSVAASHAQVPPSRGEEERRRLEAEGAHEKKVEYREEVLPDWLFLDFGGNTAVIYERIGNKTSRVIPSITAFTSDTNLWLDTELFNAHRFYSRFRMTYLDQDFTNATESHGFTGDLEELYYSGDIGNILHMRSLAGQRFQGQVTVGRQYLTLGQGMTYANFSDAVKTEAALGDLQAQFFAAKTIGYYGNIDTSVPGRDNDRRFFAGEMRYRRWQPVQPYVFFMAERDHCSEHPKDPYRDYTYNANYLGLGTEGQVVPGLSYHVEYIRQSGTTMGESIETLSDSFGNPIGVPMNIHEDPIHADALDVGFDIAPDRPDKAAFSFGYIFGSGDADRLIPASTVGGNLAGTHDRGFTEFGYVPVGFVLDPMVSNMHIYRTGFALNPFCDTKGIDSLRLGTAFYVFQKDKLTGGISDQSALRDHRNVGQELDIYLTWDPLRDVSIGTELGMFFPGDAYQRRRMNEYIMFNLSYRF